MMEDIFLLIVGLGVLFAYAFVGLFLTVLYMMVTESVEDRRVVGVLVEAWPLAFPALFVWEVIGWVNNNTRGRTS